MALKKLNIEQKKENSTIDRMISQINKTLKCEVAHRAVINQNQVYVSTGNSLLDIVISNKRYAGINLSRITSIGGLSSSGKSLLSAHLLANIQKLGGMAILIDTENAVDLNYLKVVGVDLDKLLIINCSTLEHIYNTIQQLCVMISVQYKNLPALIVVDSLTSTTIIEQIQGSHQLSGYNMKKARINSQSLKRIQATIARYNIGLVITTQLRQNMNAGLFGDKYKQSNGGQALAFYASTRLRLKQVGTIKGKVNGIERPIGVQTNAKVQKTRTSPGKLSIDFEIYFDSGIDEFNSWLNFLKKFKLIEGKGTKDNPWKVVDPKTGQFVQVGKQWAKQLTEDSVKREFIYNVIADILIMPYKTKQQVYDRQVSIQENDGQINLTGDSVQNDLLEDQDEN